MKEEKSVLNLIKDIINVEQKLTGNDYLKQFINNIGTKLDIKCVFLGHKIDKSSTQIKTDIVWSRDGFIENFTYESEETPCDVVLSGEHSYVHEQNVTKDFPKDKFLKKMKIKSYVGTPIISNIEQKASNILVILDDKPIDDINVFITIIDFLALRLSTEITQNYINEKLESIINQRTLELEKSKNKMELINKYLKLKLKKEIEKNKEQNRFIFEQSKKIAIGEMIENITHQWKQPLSVISSAYSTIKFMSELDELKKTDLDSSMDAIDSSVQHLSETIDDFKNFFKSHKFPKKFTINDTFDKVFNLTTSQFKTSGITIVKNIEDINIVGFENELVHVIINILNNARDELFKKNQIRLILIDVIKNDNNLEICIKDNAGGIPQNIISKVFKSNFTTKGEKGTGIGLYMSKRIVEEHFNGTISVNNEEFTYENRPYIGAAFKIYLQQSECLSQVERSMEWNAEKMALGIKFIDEQHQELLKIINKLSITIRNNLQVHDILNIVEELIDYAHYHFLVEEEFFDKYNYKDVDSHKNAHHLFVDKFIELKIKLAEDKTYKNKSAIEITEDVFRFSINWFLTHVMVTDKKYVKLFREKGLM